MASSYSPPTPPLHPHVAPPPPPPPPPPPFPLHDTTLAPQQPPPLAWAFPSPPPHAPARRPRPLSALAPLQAPAAASAGDTPPPYPCTLCGRPFPSKKALFGHMRCHPERPYRGMTPPRFRGRHEDGLTEDEREAAASLLTLAAGPRNKGKGKKRLLLGSPSCWNKETGGALASTTTTTSAASATVGSRPGRRSAATSGADDQAVVPATSSSRIVLAAPEETTATALDLNLPPPGTPVPRKNDDQGGSMNAMLDLKLGY